MQTRAGTSRNEEISTAPPELDRTPEPTFYKAPFLSEMPRPKFDGSDGSDVVEFLKDFEASMLDRNVDDDGIRAKHLALALVSRSRAERWFDKSEVDKTSFAAISSALKEEFKDTSQELMSDVIARLVKTSLPDAAVGRPSKSGRALHLVFCDELEKITMNCEGDIDANDAVPAIIKANVGPSLRKVLEASKKTTFSSLVRVIRTLKREEVDDIRLYGNLRNLDNQAWRSPPAPVGWRRPTNPPPPVPRVDQQPSRYAPITPAHQAALDQWEARFGNAEIKHDSNYPITPGTDLPGSRECFRCGTKRPQEHLAQNCPNKWVNQKESLFQQRVSEHRRSQRPQQGSFPLSPSNREPLGQRSEAAIHAVQYEYQENEEELLEGINWMGLQEKGSELGQ